MRNILLFTLLLILILLFNMLVHEFGHCLTMEAVGGGCAGVFVPPGIKIWPLHEFGEAFAGDWDGRLGAAVYSAAPPGDWQRGLVSLMGSGSTALLAFVALCALWVIRPSGLLKWLLWIQSWMFLDLLAYTILPAWFGLQHFFFWGGRSPEPLDGAIRMGVEQDAFIAIILVFSVMMTTGCLVAVPIIMKRVEELGEVA